MNEYVYILCAGPYYKVGRAKDLRRRLNTYKKTPDTPKPFRYVYSKSVEDAAWTERCLLKMCRRYPRRAKEWFRLPRRKVYRLKKYLDSLPRPRPMSKQTSKQVPKWHINDLDINDIRARLDWTGFSAH